MTATYDPTAQFDIDVSEEIYRSGPDGDWPVRLYRPQAKRMAFEDMPKTVLSVCLN